MEFVCDIVKLWYVPTLDDRRLGVRKGHIIFLSATCWTKVLKDVALLSHLCGPAYKVL